MDNTALFSLFDEEYQPKPNESEPLFQFNNKACYSLF
jgi:hypothetical protein